MPAIATRNDALRFELSGVEIVHLVPAGTVPGVRVIAAAARNGPGTGHLRTTGATGTLLSYKAPGSAAYGPEVDVSADGSYVVEDPDSAKWLRVQVSADYLHAGPTDGAVKLTEVYNNGVGHADLTAAEASAGHVAEYSVTMKNDSSQLLIAPRVWLDSAVSDLEISIDNAAWVSPTTEPTALVFPDLAAAGSDILYLRRTIAAAATFDPKILNLLHANFEAFF